MMSAEQKAFFEAEYPEHRDHKKREHGVVKDGCIWVACDCGVDLSVSIARALALREQWAREGISKAFIALQARRALQITFAVDGVVFRVKPSFFGTRMPNTVQEYAVRTDVWLEHFMAFDSDCDARVALLDLLLQADERAVRAFALAHELKGKDLGERASVLLGMNWKRTTPEVRVEFVFPRASRG